MCCVAKRETENTTMTTWHIMTVHPQMEQAVLRNLHRRDIPARLPIEIRRLRRSGSTRPGENIVTRRPLMPGYIFVGWKDAPPMMQLRQVPGLRGFLRQEGGRGPLVTLTPEEFQAIEIMSKGIETTPLRQERRVSLGDKIEIRRGAMVTLQGLVRRIEGAHVMVDVEMFGKTNEIRLPLAEVQAGH
jgi:transcription antitermination factor NusG